MSNIHYLAAGSTHVQPAVTLGQGLPKEVNGLPAFYYWRQSVRDGDYFHPAEKWHLNVTPERRKGWEQRFREMRKNGVTVAVVADHRDEAEAKLGNVVDVRQNGPWLEELHQYLGEQARDIALKNEVSVGIDTNYRDGTGRVYGDVIYHSAVVTNPVVPGQGPVRIAASRGQASDPVVFHLAAQGSNSMNLLDRIREALGAADLTEEQAVERIKQLKTELGEKSTQLHASLAARTDLEDKLQVSVAAQGDLEDRLQATLAAKGELEQQVRQLSARPKPQERQLDPEMLDMLVENGEQGLDGLVSTGRISPTVKDKLMLALVKDAEGKPNVLTLSRQTTGTSKSLVRQIVEALKELPSVTVDQTRVQHLGRTVPVGDPAQQEDEEAVRYAQERARRLNGEA